jgi:hypothetical protein
MKNLQGNSQQDSRIPVNEQEYWLDIAEEASVAGDWQTYQQAIERATGQKLESPIDESIPTQN